jgi:NAD(P)-dependent dehydrogenase (short-subunit alcohol dehydrogenase family)
MPSRRASEHAVASPRRDGTLAIAALYLAAPASSFVTGKLLEVDGGIEAPTST